MKYRRILICEIGQLNRESIRATNTPKVIRYLDTSSVSNNIIANIQVLDSSIEPFPSRAQRKVRDQSIIYSTVRPEQEHFAFIEKEKKNDNIIVSSGFLTFDVTDQEIDPKYLYYLVTQKYVTNHLQKIANNNVSAYPSINPDDFGSLEFVIPSDRNIQKSIANTLSFIDSKIELNNKINAELEALAKTIYDYWFVQFDFPFDFTQDKPDLHGKPYKSSGGKMVWNAELKREIPVGWEVNEIRSIVTIGSGYPFKSEDYSDNGIYKIVTIKSVQDGYLDTNKVDKIQALPHNLPEYCKLSNGDILISLTGNVGRMCFVNQENLLLNQRVGVLLGKRKYIQYIYLFFQRPEQQIRLDKISNGSSQANLSPVEAVMDYCVIPNENLIDSFSNIIDPIFQKKQIIQEENLKLSELRDWLLPMLMNGQVKIREN